MKKAWILALVIALALLCAACGGKGADGPDTAVSPTPSDLLPGLPGGQDGDDGEGGDEAPPEEGKAKSDLYDPSIFVIEAQGTLRQELAPGYYADYEFELYLDKVDSNDNRVASGLYTGVFWMKTALDTEKFLADMLKNVPVDMNFDAGGEGICDNLVMHLLDGYERDPFQNLDIPGEGGGTVTPAKEALAGAGGFVAVGTEGYLQAKAKGAGGVSLDYEAEGIATEEFSYVIHVAPDPANTATTRSVTIHLTNAQGLAVTLQGTWKRLPGYPEDVLEYANSGKASDILDKHLK